MRLKAALIAGGAALASVAACAGLLAGSAHGDGAHALTGDDFGRLRRDALALFPRGLPVADVASGLTALGFQCAPTRRLMANISAPSIECDSAGRGYPNASRTEVTVMGRNGVMSDIAIGNGVDAMVADARRPDPNPGGRPLVQEAAAERR